MRITPPRHTIPTPPFLSPANLESWYRRRLPTHPFLLFGLPFIITILGGSFLLTPATAIRYERHDRNVRSVSREEAFAMPESEARALGGVEAGGGGGVGGDGNGGSGGGGDGEEEGEKKKGGGFRQRKPRHTFDLKEEYYRLAAKDIENWEQRRVKRLPGETDGKL